LRNTPVSPQPQPATLQVQQPPNQLPSPRDATAASRKRKSCGAWALIGCGGALAAGIVATLIAVTLLGAGWGKLMHWLEGGDLPEPKAGWCSEAADCCLKAITGRFGELTDSKRASCEGLRQLRDEQCQLTYAENMRAARRYGRLCGYTTKDGGRYNPE
jgi:hypothetical protein